MRFGAAPLADPDLCYSGQYSDAALWLAQGGYVDYLMPQLYWGLDYTRDGGTANSLGAAAARWAALPRAAGVALYGGLGAYRIGDGDGQRHPRRMDDRPRAGQPVGGAGGSAGLRGAAGCTATPRCGATLPGRP